MNASHPAAKPLLDLAANHSPNAISPWWPLAPGWWILIALTLCLIGIAMLWLKRHKARNQYRRQAQQALADIQHQQLDKQQLASQCNALLKRTAITAYGQQVALLQGDAWCQYIISAAKLNDADSQSLINLEQQRYQRHCDIDANAVITACEHFIRQHRRRIPRQREAAHV